SRSASCRRTWATPTRTTSAALRFSRPASPTGSPPRLLLVSLQLPWRTTVSTAISVTNALHFIDGKEVASRSGRTFASIDPATGAELAQVAFGEAEDVDAAVDAARRTYESG